MPTITIDTQRLEFTGEPTILEVARDAGIEIPTLCYLKDLIPIGSCRVCLVEIEGAERPMTACTTPATDGAVVVTQSERLTELRRQAIRFVLVNHPLECPVCDKAGECRLQDLTVALGVSDQPYADFPHERRVDTLSPLIERSDPRCIRCGRCIAVCQEVQGVGAYRFVDRGWETRVDTVDGGPLSCEFCGQCVQVCPVGALLPRGFLHRTRVWDLEKVPSVCGYCGAGCQVEWNVNPRARTPKVLRVTSPREDNPVNGGNLCVRGMFAFDAGEHERRVTAPRIRKGSKWREVKWSEALDFAAGGLRRVVDGIGPEAVAGLGSVRMTNEEAWLFKRILADGLGTGNVGSLAGMGTSRAQDAWCEITGRTGSTATVADLRNAETIVVLGSDLAVEMPVPSLGALEAARRRDARLVVCHPMRTKLHGFATRPITYQPGEEIALVAALSSAVAAIGDPEGEPDDAVAFRALAGGIDREAACSRAGVAAAEIAEAAAQIAMGGRTVFVVGGELLNAPDSAERMRWVAGLMALSGTLSGDGSGLLFSLDRSNLQGTMDMGIVPRGDAPDPIGILDQMHDQRIRGLLLCGTDPLGSFPGRKRNEAALDALDFLVAIAPFDTAATEKADVVLPASMLSERTGTLTSAERRVRPARAAGSPPGKARPDWQILLGLAERLGVSIQAETAVRIAGRDRRDRSGLRGPVLPVAGRIRRVPAGRFRPRGEARPSVGRSAGER